MKLVILESPFAAGNGYTVEENVEYARACVRDSLSRGEAPIASHLLYTQPGILNDDIPEERSWGYRRRLSVENCRTGFRRVHRSRHFPWDEVRNACCP